MKTRVRRKYGVALGAALLLWVGCPVRTAIVIGHSMEPTLRNGQPVLVDRSYYRRHAIQRGDVLLFRHDGMLQIKRVYALPGDKVWEIHCHDTGSVFLLQQAALPRARFFAKRPGAHITITACQVPANTLYMLGDGGNASLDSRYYGPVQRAAVTGRVLLHEEVTQALLQSLERASLIHITP